MEENLVSLAVDSICTWSSQISLNFLLNFYQPVIIISFLLPLTFEILVIW